MSVIKRNMLWVGAVFILILSAITFVFVPAAGQNTANSTLVFGKWNGKPIEYVQDSYVIRQIQTLSEQMQSQGQEINQFTNFQIMQSAFNSAAVRFAILEELKSAGYTVPQSVVNKALVPYYLDAKGKYSTRIYNDTPEATRSSRRALATEELTAQRYIDDIFGTQSTAFGLKTNSKETALIAAMTGPERSFTYASFSTGAYPESEVVAYGKANPSLFVKHDLSIITVDTEAVAKKVAASLAKNEIPFEDAVTTYSTRTGADAGGKLTNSFRNDLNGLFTDAKDLETVLAIAPGALGAIVKAGSEFAIVRCNAAPVEPDFANASVIAAVSSYMNSNERGKIEDYFMAKAKEFAAAARSAGFEAACKASGIEKKTTTAFAINYGNAQILSPLPVETNTELASAVKSETFFKTAFGLKGTDVSEPVLLGTDVLVLQMNEEKAADSQMLEMIPLFYNYYAGSWSQGTLSDSVLKSKKLQNDFMTTYLKYFLN